MPADPLLADTAAIRTLGRDYTAHAAELAAVAVTLRSVPLPATALGPVGAVFVAALTDAVAEQSDAVGALEVDARAGGSAAGFTAAGYDAAVYRAAGLLPQV
ncbi:hypothetical protein M1247_34645 [Mycobacterium sp. 21AC1]|uniref:hypothetical protein n=1 Tax=[Mycobacterium] appelbergii TaxID=2939269 RepID=UPI00293913CA|nr:hypothetical protein [Mycobacterium sp. 21AC1]MDV3130086.1 hypothetical protein [Mycobacterium sp. 21AC1]